MDLSSLPRYPAPPRPDTAGPPASRRRISPRQARVFLDLVLLAGIVALLVWLGRIADAVRQPPSSPEPLDFQVVQQRFPRIHSGMRTEEVFDLLGPEHSVRFWEPEFDRIQAMVWAHPDRYPGPCSWAKWSDPKNEERWVAVFSVGGYVRDALKKGF